MQNAKILLLDIETTPNIGYTWGKFEQNVIEFVEESHLLSVAYQWYGGKTSCLSLPQYGGSERRLLLQLRQLLDAADVVVAHNGDKFDVKKINARFVKHRIPPPSPFRTIDTYKVAKRSFAFNSNKLDDIGHFLGEGRKIQHRGFEMWKGCMAGNPRDWRDMIRYNIQDVNLLVRIYRRLLPWITKVPPVSAYAGACPRCGSQRVQSRGLGPAGKYRRFQCQGCAGWLTQTIRTKEVTYKT